MENKDLGACPASPATASARLRGQAATHLEPSRSPHGAELACHDCGAPYGDPAWIEAVVPHDIWNNHLSPTGNEGGILCLGCMAKRAVAAGLSDIPVRLTAGPFK